PGRPAQGAPDLMTSLATLGHPDSKFQTLVPAPAAYAIGVVGAILTVALAGPDDLALAMG
ncbi:MAG TPA: hypothetical protein VLI04_14915, partial [Nocardioidaceae bacterium]|nr:hypothetical protein [Nocardioidaceae bacterium]